MKNNTLETKASVKNGVSRMVFAVLSILLEVGVILALIFWAGKAAGWIYTVLHILAWILVLAIYGNHKTASIRMTWMYVIMMLPIFGTALYFLIGLNGHTLKMRKRYEDVDKILLPMLPANEDVAENAAKKDGRLGGLVNYIRKQAGYPVYQNTKVEYFDDGEKGFEAQKRDFAKAEKFIFMEYHAIEDAECWHEMRDILAERVKAGVEVRVFYDDMGSLGFINTDFVKRTENYGIKCRVFNPFAPGLNLFLNNRDHRKITVIDGKVGYTGGYNLANEYFHRTEPFGFWKDTGIRLEGDAVQSLTVTFLEMWNAVSENDKDDMEFTKYLIASNAHHVLKKGGVMLNADMEERRSEEAEAASAEVNKTETDKAETGKAGTDKVEMVKNMENKIVEDVEAKIVKDAGSKIAKDTEARIVKDKEEYFGPCRGRRLHQHGGERTEVLLVYHPLSDHHGRDVPRLFAGSATRRGYPHHNTRYSGQEDRLQRDALLLQRTGQERRPDLRVHARLLPRQDVHRGRSHGDLRHDQSGLSQPVSSLRERLPVCGLRRGNGHKERF